MQKESKSMTEHVRNLMFEGEWELALRTLADGLARDRDGTAEAVSFEDCIAVLDGRKRLEGIDEIFLRDEDEETGDEYRADLRFKYGDIVNIRERGAKFKWYRPYAYVTNFGLTDMQACHGLFLGDVPRIPRSSVVLPRASHYLNDRTHDACFYTDSRWEVEEYHNAVAFLLEPCNAPPFWFPVNHDIVKAVMICAETGRYLEERGHRQWYGQLDCDDTELDIDRRHREKILQDQPESPVHRNVPAIPGISDSVTDSILSMIQGDVDDRSIPDQDFECSSSSGWILPDGRYFGCEYFQHRPLARRILLHVFDIDEQDLPDDAQIDLDERGAIRVQQSADGERVQFIMDFGKRVTKAQEKTVVKYTVRHGIPYPETLLP